MTNNDWRSEAVQKWEDAGMYRSLCGSQIFTMDLPSLGPEVGEPILVLHGFPTSSFDFHNVVGDLQANRRILLFDQLGYGFSEKPDVAYTIGMQTDIAVAYLDELDLARVALLTHDVGDTVGGELLARQLEGSWNGEVTERVITNGSIYIEMAHLSVGQEILLSLPDERLAPENSLDEASLAASLAATFSPNTQVDNEELADLAEVIAYRQGDLVLPRLIRYIEERRRNQDRFTGAIERHSSPLSIIWGADDPIAVVEMAERLAPVPAVVSKQILEGVGHYPMVESPKRFATLVAAAFNRTR